MHKQQSLLPPQSFVLSDHSHLVRGNGQKILHFIYFFLIEYFSDTSARPAGGGGWRDERGSHLYSVSGEMLQSWFRSLLDAEAAPFKKPDVAFPEFVTRGGQRKREGERSESVWRYRWILTLHWQADASSPQRDSEGAEKRGMTTRREDLDGGG